MQAGDLVFKKRLFALFSWGARPKFTNIRSPLCFALYMAGGFLGRLEIPSARVQSSAPNRRSTETSKFFDRPAPKNATKLCKTSARTKYSTSIAHSEKGEHRRNFSTTNTGRSQDGGALVAFFSSF
jgi:hypothetical protein